MVPDRKLGWFLIILALVAYIVTFIASQVGILPPDAWITGVYIAYVYLGVAAFLISVRYFSRRQIVNSFFFFLMFIGLTVMGWSIFLK